MIQRYYDGIGLAQASLIRILKNNIVTESLALSEEIENV